MCLLVWGYREHPQYKLVIAANRDDAYHRPTRAAQLWTDQPDILACKDLKSGGTWMGIHRSGRLAAITNFRNPNIQKEDPPSRGHLVADFLKKSVDPDRYLRQIDQKADRYMGFNLLCGSPEGFYYYSNQQKRIQSLSAGLYGLSNHQLDTPWPKVQRAKKRLAHILGKNKVSEQALFDLLADDTQAPDEELPDTGLPKEIEKQVSPVFIKGEEYGTRCSTILLIDQNDEVTFAERRFKAGTEEVMGEKRYSFSIKPNILTRAGRSRHS